MSAYLEEAEDQDGDSEDTDVMAAEANEDTIIITLTISQAETLKEIAAML